MREELRKLDDLFTVEGLKNNWSVLAVSSIFLLALWLRYMPEQGMAYLQALDPYMIFRMSQHLALEGNLPALDFARYFPYATPTYLLNQGNIVFPSIIYWMGPFLFFENFMEWAQFYPALMGSLSVVITYFFGKEIWDRLAGVSAAFMLATIPGVMHRTSAGFFEKEPIGTFFMMASLYLFVRAWNRDEWLPGIGSGIMFGFFTISWGGSKMLWLLYPLVTGSLIFINQDVKKLMKAYTPTILLGGLIASALNPSRFWITSSLFLANIGLAGLIWSRYLAEELQILDENQLKYYVPSISAAGIFAVLASPLYYPPIYGKFLSVLNMATQSAGGVIAGTVAENQAASFGQLVTQLSSLSSANILGPAGFLANIFGAFPLSFISIPLMGTALGFMVLKKFDVLEEVESSTYYMAMAAVFLAWSVGFAAYFNFIVGASANLTLVLAPIFVTFIAAVAFKASNIEETFEIDFNWIYVLPLFWALSNTLMAIAKSRLIFLAAFPVAITSGYTISILVNGIRNLDLSEYFSSTEDANQVVIGLIAVISLLVVAVNVSAGFASVQSLGGSPNQAWMQNLDAMENQTESGAVILSWWDYGYWFESIGRRAAVADGGNLNYYNTDEKYGKINYPLADFLASENPGNHTGFLRKHSVDYIVLDSSMIGKYSAVSQIHHRSNSEFNSMITLATPGSLQQSLSQSDNQKMVQYRGTNIRTRGLNLYVPLEGTNSSLGLGSPSTLRTPRGNLRIKCTLTEDGIKNFNGSSPYCLAEDPYMSLERASQTGGRSRAILVPKEIARSTLVRLYLMNGAGVEWAEPFPEASNGYVRMWKVDMS